MSKVLDQTKVPIAPFTCVRRLLIVLEGLASREHAQWTQIGFVRLCCHARDVSELGFLKSARCSLAGFQEVVLGPLSTHPTKTVVTFSVVIDLNVGLPIFLRKCSEGWLFA